MTQERLQELLLNMSQGNYLKQAAVILLIFLIGLFFLSMIRKEMEQVWIWLLAFPMGLALWCLLSLFLLVTGIPYTLLAVLAILAAVLLLAAVYGYRIEKVSNKPSKKLIFLMSVIVVISVLIASWGILKISVSNDSMYYYSLFPRIIAINKGYVKAFDVFMSDVGPTAALVGTLPHFFGFDNIYGIQQFLNINFAFLFAYAVFEQWKIKGAVIAAALSTAVLFTATPFTAVSKWILANDYVMIYTFILFYLAWKMGSTKGCKKSDYLCAMAIMTAMVSMLRMEGSILACFLIVCISTLHYSNKEMAAVFILPMLISQGAYYLKYFLGLDISPEYSFLDGKKALMGVGLIIALGIYLLFIRNRILLKLQYHLLWLVLGALLLVNVALFALSSGRYAHNLKMFFENIVYQQGWGYTVYLLLVLALILPNKSKKLSYIDVFWMGYILFTIAVSFVRGGELRRGIGDSGNRVMLQVVPFIVYSLTIKVRDVCIYCEKSKEKI